MMEKLRFDELFWQAWHASISPKLAWAFGLIIGVVSILLMMPDDTTAPNIFYFEKFVRIFSGQASDNWIWIFILLGFVLLFVVKTFGESNLIVSLSFVAGKTDLPNYPDTVRAMSKNFFRALLVEGMALFLILAIIGILSLPLWIAYTHNPQTMDLLSVLVLLTLIPIIIMIFFIRKYSLFYFLLSPLSLRGAIENAGALFSRFFFHSLLFSLFFSVLFILFTFCWKLVTLGIVAIVHWIAMPLGEEAISLVVSFVFFVWFAVFQQALWMAFFKSITSIRDTKIAVTEKETAFADSLPEIPPVKNQGV
jgi:hypothetical protein